MVPHDPVFLINVAMVGQSAFPFVLARILAESSCFLLPLRAVSCFNKEDIRSVRFPAVISLYPFFFFVTLSIFLLSLPARVDPLSDDTVHARVFFFLPLSHPNRLTPLFSLYPVFLPELLPSFASPIRFLPPRGTSCLADLFVG